jgi:carbamoyltransferase
MKVLGISPLDKDATVSLVEDGRVLFAAAEERYSRQKQHAGFPHEALADCLETTGTNVSDIDEVSYAFLEPEQEARLMRKHVGSDLSENLSPPAMATALQAALEKQAHAADNVPGLDIPNRRMEKGFVKEFAYWLFGAAPLVSGLMTKRMAWRWVKSAVSDHQRWNAELTQTLAKHGLSDKLKRYEHHRSHAANAYYASGYERALIITLDGYGTGLAGSISIGEGGKIKRLHNLHYPYSLGTFYENVTGALGFKPDRHAGKIVGLAAYGDPAVLHDVVMSRFTVENGDCKIARNLNVYLDQYLASRFTMIDIAAAYQQALEEVAAKVVKCWVDQTNCDTVVLSGGVTANVKMNQRIFEINGVNNIFVYPNMGDGGCGTGLAYLASWPGEVGEPLESAYHGPDFTEAQALAALEAENVPFTKPDHLAAEVASLIHNGKVVARCDGRMEYGPRSLGNRSIMYHAKNPDVNRWLNQRLGRTEFMPFAPVTCWEDRHKCYHNLTGAEHTAQFMTITFDCTDWMRENCPAAVHVDGTARPQLVKREVNPGYYDILREYEKLSGISTLINTSFNMHEEPIVCDPKDAVRAFLDGRLDHLALGPFLASQPEGTGLAVGRT